MHIDWSDAVQVGSKGKRDFVGTIKPKGHNQHHGVRGKTVEALVEEALDPYRGEIVIDRACFHDAEDGLIVYVNGVPGKACGNLLMALRSAIESESAARLSACLRQTRPPLPTASPA